MSSAENLTGVWQGLYSYPREMASASFVATLIDVQASISGTTHETALDVQQRMTTLFATVAGERDGAAVAFAKTYDGSGGWRHAVFYDGRVNGDSTEIEGRWNIPGVWSGKFLMIRSRGAEKMVEQQVAAPVSLSSRP